jgi:hypothetical protein
MRAAGLVALVLLGAGCEPRPQPERATPAGSASVDTQREPERSREYAVGDHVLRLVVTSDSCTIEHRSAKSAMREVALDLRPPCYLLTWLQQPPQSNATADVSDGQPVGGTGDPMALRYASAGGVVTLAIIGDTIPQELREGSLYQLREQQGLRCAASVQAVLLDTDQIQLSKKRERIGVLCVELGLEERDFWLLAHP